ncbi:hypothetical protein VFPBJ_00317 [Purpureocillium lilacinum]|uniref:Uncharacterized protein n=1 Tax=Purpureocillium lilacinum TaxID=33203 RepID=A0A179H806_PURLI|nr:hypothetical protein VFPBJ_00317 [Purpureocillium lilacinum]
MSRGLRTHTAVLDSADASEPDAQRQDTRTDETTPEAYCPGAEPPAVTAPGGQLQTLSTAVHTSSCATPDSRSHRSLRRQRDSPASKPRPTTRRGDDDSGRLQQAGTVPIQLGHQLRQRWCLRHKVNAAAKGVVFKLWTKDFGPAPAAANDRLRCVSRQTLGQSEVERHPESLGCLFPPARPRPSTFLDLIDSFNPFHPLPPLPPLPSSSTTSTLFAPGSVVLGARSDTTATKILPIRRSRKGLHPQPIYFAAATTLAACTPPYASPAAKNPATSRSTGYFFLFPFGVATTFPRHQRQLPSPSSRTVPTCRWRQHPWKPPAQLVWSARPVQHESDRRHSQGKGAPRTGARRCYQPLSNASDPRGDKDRLSDPFHLSVCSCLPSTPPAGSSTKTAAIPQPVLHSIELALLLSRRRTCSCLSKGPVSSTRRLGAQAVTGSFLFPSTS